MEEWKNYHLEDVCSRLRSGKGIKSDLVSDKGTYPVIGGNGVRGYTETSNFKGSCGVIGRQGAYCGNVRFFEGEAYMTEHAVVVVGNEIADTHYLTYLLSLMHLGNLSAQSAQPGLSVHTLSKQLISLPNIEQQKQVSAIIKSLDNKIALNRRINDNLEQQAQALYEEYFTNEDVSERVELGTVIDTTSGGTPSRSIVSYFEKGNINWVKSKELNSTFLTNTEEFITDLAMKKSAAKLLPSNSILIAMYGATVGEYAIISKEMACNQAVCALLPNNNYPYTYLFMFAKNKKEELINKAVGSAQQNISQILIKQLFVSSNIRLIKKYDESTGSLFEEIKKNMAENEKLSSLRDSLLPKLMSGELKTGDLHR